MTQKTYHQYCAIAHALDLIGERWTLLIIRNLFTGPQRFSDLVRGLPGIGTNILTTRLKALEESGLVQSRYLPPPAASSVYELTAYGKSLEDVLAALAQLGMQSMGDPTADQVITPEAMALMLYRLLKPLTQPGLSMNFGVVFEDARFSGRFGVKFQGDSLSIEANAEGAPDFTVRLGLESFRAIATGQHTFKEEMANSTIHFDGSEARIAQFLAQLERINN